MLSRSEKGDHELARAVNQNEAEKVMSNGGGDVGGIHRPGELEARANHLQVFSRQQIARARDVNRIAGQLHAVFRSAQRGGANALAGGKQRQREAAGIESIANGAPEAAAQIAEVALLAVVDV